MVGLVAAKSSEQADPETSPAAFGFNLPLPVGGNAHVQGVWPREAGGSGGMPMMKG